MTDADELVRGVVSDMEVMAEEAGSSLSERDMEVIEATVRTLLVRLEAETKPPADPAPEKVAALRALAEAATPGPWQWRGYTSGSIELRTVGRGGQRIVSTQRSQPCVVELDDGGIALTRSACGSCRHEWNKPHDAFTDRATPCEVQENLDTIWLRDADAGFIRPANHWARREVPYRDDVVAVDQPDAAFIAAANPAAILELLDDLDRLRAAAGYDVARIEEGERPALADAELTAHREVHDRLRAALVRLTEIDQRTPVGNCISLINAALAASDEAVGP